MKLKKKSLKENLIIEFANFHLKQNINFIT